jgi:hypothetical protein
MLLCTNVASMLLLCDSQPCFWMQVVPLQKCQHCGRAKCCHMGTPCAPAQHELPCALWPCRHKATCHVSPKVHCHSIHCLQAYITVSADGWKLLLPTQVIYGNACCIVNAARPHHPMFPWQQPCRERRVPQLAQAKKWEDLQYAMCRKWNRKSGDSVEPPTTLHSVYKQTLLKHRRGRRRVTLQPAPMPSYTDHPRCLLRRSTMFPTLDI